jgi:hypothetical protein
MQQRLQGIANVAHQIGPIGHLEGVRSRLSAGQRIGVSALADQERHGRMGLQPLDQRLGGAALEHRHRLLAFQAHHERRRGQASSPRELIHTHDTRRGHEDGFSTLAADERVWARHIAEPARQPRGGLCMAGMGQFQQNLAQAFRLAGIPGQDPRERFHKDPPQAGRDITKEAAGVHEQSHGPAAPG